MNSTYLHGVGPRVDEDSANGVLFDLYVEWALKIHDRGWYKTLLAQTVSSEWLFHRTLDSVATKSAHK
jgi:hypothetical protein